jgi:four helix bundle suffix protein
MPDGFIPPHGGYQDLRSYRKAEIVHDVTVSFCGRFLPERDRTAEQMVQAARSGKQNIAEGSMASGLSREMELKLLGVARASLEELLVDYRDFLRTRSLRTWDKHSRQAEYVRALGGSPDCSYELFREHVDTRPAEVVASIAICLIHRAGYLLDRQIRSLEQAFVREGGIRERMSRARRDQRRRQDREGNEDQP